MRHSGLGRAKPAYQNRRRARHRCGSGSDAARFHRGAGRTVRILHTGNDDAGAGIARAQCVAFASGNPLTYESESLPLRHPYAHIARDRTRGSRLQNGRQPVSRIGAAGISRRSFLAGAGALVVSFSLLPKLAPAQGEGRSAAAKTPALPESLRGAPLLDSWIRIEAAGRITG